MKRGRSRPFTRLFEEETAMRTIMIFGAMGVMLALGAGGALAAGGGGGGGPGNGLPEYDSNFAIFQQEASPPSAFEGRSAEESEPRAPHKPRHKMVRQPSQE
jgi:hypothetical protein